MLEMLPTLSLDQRIAEHACQQQVHGNPISHHNQSNKAFHGYTCSFGFEDNWIMWLPGRL
jgi:hypothetical protein